MFQRLFNNRRDIAVFISIFAIEVVIDDGKHENETGTLALFL